MAAAKRGDNGRNAVIALRRATRAASLNPQQQQERLARSNASVIRRAARAVIRNHLDVASLSSSDRGQPIVPSLLCFDEMQVCHLRRRIRPLLYRQNGAAAAAAVVFVPFADAFAFYCCHTLKLQ